MNEVKTNIVSLYDADDDIATKRMQNLINLLQKGNPKVVALVFDEDNQVSLFASAKHPAELMVMKYHLDSLTEHLVRTYSSIIMDFDDDYED